MDLTPRILGRRIVRRFYLMLRPILRPVAWRARSFMTAEQIPQLERLQSVQSLILDQITRIANGSTSAGGGPAARAASGLRHVHQFHSGSAVGDAVTNSMLRTRSMLRAMGYRSDIFVAHRDPALANELRLVEELPEHDAYVLVLHHSTGFDSFQRVMALPAPKLLVYHNITPPELLGGAPHAQRYAALGRDQLMAMRPGMRAAIGISATNALELRRLGFANVAVCPLLFDLEAMRRAAAAARAPRPANAPFTVLFVGRVFAHKAQAELAEAFLRFRAAWQAPCRLILVGRYDEGADSEAARIRAIARAAGAEEAIILTGLVDDGMLWRHYTQADLFVSLSQHEGFGVPLVEAMVAGVPVLAWPAGAVAQTLGGTAELLPSRAPDSVAQAMLALARSPEQRTAQAARQQAGLARYATESWRPDFAAALAAAGAEILARTSERRGLLAGLRFAIAGHVKGSYSLAQINRTMAKSLEQALPGRVRLLPIEGSATRDLAELDAAEHAAMARLRDRPAPPDGPELVICQHYPVINPGQGFDLRMALLPWEESLLPASMIAALARHYDLVLATSRFTAKALLDSGLTLPVVADGQPADLSAYLPLAAQRRRGAPMTFLHVSSCFPRKGADVLLHAWAAAFTAADPVRLVIKTFPNPHNQIEQQLAALRGRHPNLAPITLINRDIQDAELHDLYRDADAMVLPTRGEGYNLPALEAMAAGLALIVTAIGGHRDFCGPETARLVACRLAYSTSHVAPSLSLWTEPDPADLARALREMIDPAQQDAIADRSARAHAQALALSDSGGWVARLARTATAALTAPPPRPPRIAWISSWNVACGIAEYSRTLIAHLPRSAQRGLRIFCDDRTTMAGRDDAFPVEISWQLGFTPGQHELMRSLRRHDPDVVIIQHQAGLFGWPALADILRTLHKDGRIILLTLHGVADLFALAEATRQETLAALRLADRILVHTLADVNLLAQADLSERVTLFPHGAESPHAVPDIRAFDTAPVIGSHGFFLPHKGLRGLIRAAATLRGKWPNLRLRLVNAEFPDAISAIEIAACRALASELGIAEAVEWHTAFLPITQVKELLSGCDVIALPYEASVESASGALHVALASLVPVAASQVPIFEEAGNAVHWLDPSAEIAPALSSLLDDQEARRALQLRAREWLAQRDWNTLGQRLAAMADGLVRNRDFAAWQQLETAVDPAVTPTGR